MPGGTKASYDAIESLLTKMAAKVEDGPCVAYVGPGGSGHFVKTVHNGIEYGIEQILAEAYDLMKRVKGCLLYTSPSPRDVGISRMPSSA